MFSVSHASQSRKGFAPPQAAADHNWRLECVVQSIERRSDLILSTAPPTFQAGQKLDSISALHGQDLGGGQRLGDVGPTDRGGLREWTNAPAATASLYEAKRLH
jgi:hypothetical protein